MKRLTTYSEIEFLESFFRSIPANPFESMVLNDNSDLQDWSSMLDIIYKNSELYIENIETFVNKSKSNPFFQRLINDSNAGGSKIRETKFFKDLLENEICLTQFKPSGIHYYKNETSSCKLGVFTNSLKTWKNGIKSISARKSYNVNKNKYLNNFPGWNILKNTGLPINAAIISDRYFLKWNNSYKYNLFDLLVNLIPNDLKNTDFHLTIITSIEDYDNPMNYYQEINSFLKRKITPIVSFSLIAKPVRECPHDREIITNYYRLISGNSFDYYNKFGNIRYNTTLEYFAINSETGNTHTLKLKEFKSLLENAEYFGTGRNRLLN